MARRPTRSQLRLRLPQLLAGLTVVGLGIALMVNSRLGLSPWEVLHQGLSRRTGIPIGTMGILVGLLVLLAWVPLRERPGLGTVLNVILIGVVIDVVRLVLPTPQGWPWRAAFLGGGLLAFGWGVGAYIGAGLGPGPRDGLMTGIARRGHSIAVVRTSLEVGALAAGILLGGTAGVGTVLFAFTIGPMVAFFLPRLTIASGVAAAHSGQPGTGEGSAPMVAPSSK